MGRITLRLLAAGAAAALMGGVAVAVSGHSGIGHPASRSWTQVLQQTKPHGSKKHVLPPTGASTGTVTAAGSAAASRAAVTTTAAVTSSTSSPAAQWRMAPTSASDVWATGDDAGSLELAHWVGGRWRTVAVPRALGLPMLGTLALARAPGEVWLVGRTGAGVRVVSWNGRTFTPARAPELDLGDCVTTGVGGLVETAQGTWLAGTAKAGHGCRGTMAFLARWTGRTWVREPLPAMPGSGLAGIAATASGGLWAYGGAGAGADTRSLLLTYGGGGWHLVHVAALSKPIIAAAPDGTGGLWFATNTTYAHLNAAGWRGFSLPRAGGATITSLVWTPGTRSVDLVGEPAGTATSAKGGLETPAVLARLG